MRFRNLFPAIITTVTLTSLIATLAMAEDYSSAPASNTPIEFQVALKNGEIVGSDQIQRAIVSVGTNQLLAVLPRGLRMESSASDKIVVVPQDYSYFLTLRILKTSTTRSLQARPENFRNILTARYPGATIVEESVISVCDRSSTVFDLQWKTPGSATRCVRIAFIPSSMGLLEASVIANAQKSEEAMYQFNVFVNSFRSNEAGPIVVTMTSDAS